MASEELGNSCPAVHRVDRVGGMARDRKATISGLHRWELGDAVVRCDGWGEDMDMNNLFELCPYQQVDILKVLSSDQLKDLQNYTDNNPYRLLSRPGVLHQLSAH